MHARGSALLFHPFPDFERREMLRLPLLVSSRLIYSYRIAANPALNINKKHIVNHHVVLLWFSQI